MPLCFAKPSPPSGWLGNFHPQAIEHARHTTNPLRGSRVTWTTVFQPCMVRRNWIVPQLRPTVSDNTRVEVIVPISFKGDSRRWRTNPLNHQSHPICNVACNPLISLPVSNIQCPYTQDPCHTRGGCGRLTVRRTRQPRRTRGVSRHSRHGSVSSTARLGSPHSEIAAAEVRAG